jgi:hypothetical protein
MWKEAVELSLRIYPAKLPGGTKNIMKSIIQGSWYLGQDLKVGAPRRESGVITA